MPTYINLIVEFLTLNPKPTDKQMHALADAIGVDKEGLEAEIYAITAQLLRDQGIVPAEEEVSPVATLEIPEGV